MKGVHEHNPCESVGYKRGVQCGTCRRIWGGGRADFVFVFL